ncbi:MAG TPA: SDR family NAD(P)-dependent oxidoreductase [Candidatus Acidoferrales bacterium]|nr:SDR family NAD(P)-dependent oxidoreductase [Candidatus Acidoferrales bacterium]
MPSSSFSQRIRKIVIVAGGAGGLGRAVSLAFLNEGDTVAVPYRSQAEFAALSTAAGENAGSLDGQQLDVTDEASVKQFIDGVVARHGHVHALVNTVGGYIGGVKLWELADAADLDRMLALNVRSGFVLARAAVRVMLRQGSGCIVNVAARAAVDHPAGASAYAASKAAAVAMIGSLAADLKGTGVRANSILPSIIDTEANRKAMPDADFSKWPKPDDIARVILFLCSDEAKLVHGAAIPVYGNA